MNPKLSTLLFLAFSFSLLAQQPELIPENFRVTGDAITLGDNCFRLTPAEEWRGGAIWYSNALDMAHPFEIELEAEFGCDDYGADGIVFLLHPALVTGQEGEGMGFGQLNPSFGIEMDTYQNYHLGDPGWDHVGIMKNGSVNHADGIGKPAPILANKANIEDCASHQILIQWNPDFNNIRLSVDGNLRININYNVIRNIFPNNSNVFWGFSSATGGEFNVHKICLKKVTYEKVSQLDLLTISKIIDGKDQILKNIQFEADGFTLTKASKTELMKLANLIQGYPDYSMMINVHTDDVLSEKKSQELSDKRAKSIKDFLVEKGVKAKRIEAKGHGSRYPKFLNTKPAERLKNNRVVVYMQQLRV